MSSAEWFLLLEKKVYTSTGGTVGGHSTEERLLTLFIIDFYVMLRLFSSAVEFAGSPCDGVQMHLQRGVG